MSKLQIHRPFFVFNPKSFLYGNELLELALIADDLAREYPVSILVTAPYADISNISRETENIIVTAQHMNGIRPGVGMGHVLPASLFEAGARATFLNHAENPMTLSDLSNAVQIADELGILTVVCADSVIEAQAVSMLEPDIVLCEPTELIGTGQTSDRDYIKETNKAIKKVNPNILVMQAAGISDAEDVYRTISLEADGTGCTSGIVKAKNPKQMLMDMVKAAAGVGKNR